MGAIDDTRKLLQDLITPDLKALEARLAALEGKMDLKFDHVDKRFAELEKRLELKFDIVAASAAANHSAIMYALDMNRRIERLESERASPKELDRPT